jgi:hypothetical protein
MSLLDAANSMFKNNQVRPTAVKGAVIRRKGGHTLFMFNMAHVSVLKDYLTQEMVQDIIGLFSNGAQFVKVEASDSIQPYDHQRKYEIWSAVFEGESTYPIQRVG